MKEPKELTNEELRARLRQMAADERGLLVTVLRHLAEWDRREALLELGFSSLYDYCRRELRYSEDEAVRRIIVARAGARFTRLFAMLEEGMLSLTLASTLCPHLNAGNIDSVLDKAGDMSIQQARSWAASQSPQKDRPDSIKPLAAGRNLFSFTGSDELMRKLERGRELLWHKHPDGRLEHVIGQAMDDFLLKRDPALKVAVRPGASSEGRYVPQAVRLEVWKRDEGRCAFTAADGRRCGETSGLEFDHVRPYALGGPTAIENLRLLCRAHNQFLAREVFGEEAARHARH